VTNTALGERHGTVNLEWTSTLSGRRASRWARTARTPRPAALPRLAALLVGRSAHSGGACSAGLTSAHGSLCSRVTPFPARVSGRSRPVASRSRSPFAIEASLRSASRRSSSDVRLTSVGSPSPGVVPPAAPFSPAQHDNPGRAGLNGAARSASETTSPRELRSLEMMKIA
jgi:hypothetical protein